MTTLMLHDARCDRDLCAPECKIRQWCESNDLPYPGSPNNRRNQ